MDVNLPSYIGVGVLKVNWGLEEDYSKWKHL